MVPLRLALLLPFFTLACAGTPVKDVNPGDAYAMELAEGELGLELLQDGQPWPDFSIGWAQRKELHQAVQYSLDYLAKPSSKTFFPYGPITHEKMVASLGRFQDLLDTCINPQHFLDSLKSEFQVWMARGRSNTGDVLFTGYCTPILKGNLTRTDRFQFPLYSKPSDLVKGKDGATLGRRTSSGIVPYFTRAELMENGHLTGSEIVWLDDAYDAFIAHVQGSALIELPDGKRMEIGYAGKNGHDYKSVGKYLIETGKIGKSELSLTRLRRYFKENPAEVDRVLPINPSFVFFQKYEGGPYGCLGQPVTAVRSMATDKDVFPRAALVYAEVRLPDFDDAGNLIQRPTRFFALDQDRGGAILSAGRCDIFLGVGPEATARAGHVLAKGRMYYLFLK